MDKGSQTFSAKGQFVKILGFVGYMVSIATVRVYSWRAEVASEMLAKHTTE